MFQIPDMSNRFFASELMDDIHGSQEDLFRTLSQFRAINALFSRSRTLVKRYLFPHMLRQGDRHIVCADLGAGGADFALWFTRWCRGKGLRVKMLCVDHDPRVVRFAQEACSGHDDIAVVEASAESIGVINGPIDYIFCNHFLHHIESGKIPGLLKTIHDTARCGFLLNDLARSKAAYAGFGSFCRVFFRSTMSCRDGLLSIRKGFTKREIAGLAAQAAFSTPFVAGTLHPARVFLYCLKETTEKRKVPSVNAVAGTGA
jgi:hypothetical protein